MTRSFGIFLSSQHINNINKIKSRLSLCLSFTEDLYEADSITLDYGLSCRDALTMNMSEAMKFKTKIQTDCGIDMTMLDTTEDGIVLYVERKSLNAASYKLLADFAAKNQLNLQLDSGNFIISIHALSPQ